MSMPDAPLSRDATAVTALPATGETMRVGVRVPVFNPDDPELWFAQLEGQFTLSGIREDSTKFYYVLAQLEPQHTAEIRDLVVAPPSTGRYDKLKAELIRRLSASQERKIKQLLMHEELGDRKPTQFLRHLQHLAGPTVPTDFIRTIWSSRLPTHLQTCIAAQHTKMSLEDIAELADRINEIVPATLQVSEQVAVPVAGRVAGQVASASSSTLGVPSTSFESLNQTVAELSKQMEILSMQLNRRQPRSRSRFAIDRSRRHSRARSRSQTNNYPYCWYHYRFGERARKCIQPCSYKKMGNSQGSQ
ncbi:uncharacterized protein LOC126775638 [Nymphalis io]|uniref:uncharacterized protein LOC126775638 n=1 Tax=Inachis io TaxID=171585 RepID=UPI00216AA424|nr:uncharacterized protein LOC126775638 [Nymphalis io]